MNIVLDTNVLVSGLLKPSGPPGAIVMMTSAGFLTLCYDARILEEYRDVLKRPKFHFNDSDVEAFLDQIESSGTLVAAEPLKIRLPDQSDEPFLEVALAGQAEFLVTGNEKDFPSKACNPVRIVSPKDFLNHYRK